MADDPLPESDTEDADAGVSDALQEVHKLALQRFDSVAMPQAEMRAQSLEDRRFVTIPGAQWEGQWGEQNENAPRPEVDKITKSLEKIETDYRENRLTVDFKPANSLADQDTADLLDGLHRADSYNFKAQQARDNAFQEAIRGGFGAYRLTTDYADPYDKDSDAQRINPGMTIPDADQAVYFGPSALYDKSDAPWVFVVSADAREIAVDKWGEDNIDEWGTPRLDYKFDWYTPEIVRTAEYYVVEDSTDKLIILTNDVTDEERRFYQSEITNEELADLKAQGWKRRTRTGKRKRVRKYILNGTKVLKDCGYIAGDSLPIVPVYGRRDYVDGMERWRGHVAKRKDRQRLYNAGVANLAETQAQAPFEVPIVAAEQIAGHVTGPDGALMTLAEHWARGNIDRAPFRVINPLVDPVTGQYVQLGPLGKIEPPQVQPATAAVLQITSQDLTDDDDGADEVKANVSADAMDIAAERVDSRSAMYLDNMRQSVEREAEIYKGMARDIYCEPGRVVDTLSADGEDGTAQLGEQIVDDNNVYRIRHDLSRGRYKVVASVQESTSTKRQKAVRQSLGMAEVAIKAGDVDLAKACVLTAMTNVDGEGMENLQRYARNLGIQIGLIEPTPEEQQKLAQAAQGQQPSPADQALAAQANELASKAKLNEAKSVETLASAHLKSAQAEVVGGPVSEPDKPSGLSAPEVVEKLASADLKTAQAEHLRHGMGLKAAETVHGMHMAERQQDHAEKAPKEAA
jgi:hypothetical protein